MEILGVKIEFEPFSDDELELAVDSIDFIVKIDVVDLKWILEVFNVIISEKHSIGYIHIYPTGNITIIGVKHKLHILRKCFNLELE